MGEIDCREGLLLALERDRYRNLEEGITTTVRLFTAVLKTLINKKKFKVHFTPHLQCIHNFQIFFKVYIQPILPVLDETRQIVNAYNTIYRKEVEKLKGQKKYLFRNIDDRKVL